MMSLFIAPRRKMPPAPGCSAIPAGWKGRTCCASETVSRPPVVLVHGDSDELLPLHRLQHAQAALEENGFEVAAHVRPGLGHGIDEAGHRDRPPFPVLPPREGHLSQPAGVDTRAGAPQ